MIAALPMYDRPETAAANDRFWALIRDRLRHAGLAAPDRLTRDRDELALWQDPALLFSQTCGLPFRARLSDRVTLVGTPDYGLPGCAPGMYRSAIVARADAGALTEPARRRWAVNSLLSQSGWAAALAHVGPISAPLVTGSHAASARAVAEGHADLAAIDAQTWRMIERFDGALAARLTVIDWTAPTPGLPFITAAGRDPAPIAPAVAGAIAGLAPGDRTILDLRALVPVPKAAYMSLPVP